MQDITAPLPSETRIKFFNFGVNSPGVNFYANDTKMTAVGTAVCTPPTDPACLQGGIEATGGVNYGGVGAGGLYMSIPAGQYTIRGRIASAIDTLRNIPISNLPVTLADGKAYSFYQSGRYDATTRTVDAFIVEDNFGAQIDFTRAYVRFVNAVFNSQPMTLHGKLTATGAEGALGGAVPYKGAGEFIAIPQGSYDLYTRSAGSDANVMSRTGVSFSAGRVYTISARGDLTVTSTLLLDNTTNR